jgi:hypothetical protein
VVWVGWCSDDVFRGGMAVSEVVSSKLYVPGLSLS